MAITVNYTVPGGVGFLGTNPPSYAQMALVNEVVAQVVMGDTDTAAAVTHGIAFTSAQLGSGSPQCYLAVAAPGLGTTPAPVFAVVTNTQIVTLTKISLVGSNGTFLLTVAKPNTITQ